MKTTNSGTQQNEGTMNSQNEFRTADAFEFVDAYRAGVEFDIETLERRIGTLSERIGNLQGEAPTYLLAAYRGYEAALDFKRTGWPPKTIKINDSLPSQVRG